MIEFVKNNPEVIIIYVSFVTTLFMALISYWTRETLNTIKDDLKELRDNTNSLNTRVTVLEAKEKFN